MSEAAKPRVYDWVQMAEGVRRRILQDGEKLMLVQVMFEKDGVSAPLHSHVHEQTTYVVSGQLTFTLDGKNTILKAGDSIYIPSNVVHGVERADANTVVLDAFSPAREDFRG